MTKAFLNQIMRDPKYYSALLPHVYEPGDYWSIIGNRFLLIRKLNAPLFTEEHLPDTAASVIKMYDELANYAEHNIKLPTKKEVAAYRKEHKTERDSWGNLRFHLDCGDHWSSWTTDVDAARLEQILGVFDRYDELYAWNKGPTRPIIVWNDDGTTEALIMPIRPMEERKDDATV